MAGLPNVGITDNQLGVHREGNVNATTDYMVTEGGADDDSYFYTEYPTWETSTENTVKSDGNCQKTLSGAFLSIWVYYLLGHFNA